MAANTLQKPQVREVKKVLLHLHLDEAFADFLSDEFGAKVFLGIRDAERFFPARISRRAKQEWILDKVLVLGGGGYIDEHTSGKKARMEKTSASELLGREIGIKLSRIYGEACDEVTHWDNNKGCPKMHLGSILKMLRVQNTASGEEYQDKLRNALKWAKRAIKYVIVCQSKKLQVQPGEEPFLEFMSKVVDSDLESYPFAEAREGMMKKISKEENAEHCTFFGLKAIYEALWRTSKTEKLEDRFEGIQGEITFALRVLYKDQENFHNFLRRMEANPPHEFFVEVPANGKWHTLRGAAVLSDNPAAHSALRYAGFDITIVMNESCNVTIMGNQDEVSRRGIMAQMQNGFQSLAAMCRYRDLPDGAKKSANWEVLSFLGQSGSDETDWYLPSLAWLALYKGTYNHWSPGTRIKLADLQEMTAMAFDPKGVQSWKQRVGFPRQWFSLSKKSWFKSVETESSLDELAKALDSR